MKANLEDAQAMAAQHPETFFAPPEEDLVLLTEGQNVQLCAAGERFWMRITEISYPKFEGMVNNDLVETDAHGLEFGDVIPFEAKHIYKIYTGW